MISVSLCMIVRDEEAVLSRCLDSVKDVVDEIVIVDTGSQDRTREIALQYTDRVFEFPWIHDFSAARNFSFEQAKMDYILWLDADDVLPDPEGFRQMLRQLPPEADTVMLPYQTAFDQEGKPTFWFYRERLMRRDPRALWKGAVHEVITPFGVTLRRDVPVRHLKPPAPYSRRNLEIYQDQLAQGKSFEPRDQFYYARELYYHREYNEAISQLEKYLEGAGWVENQIEACMVLASCHEAQGRQLNAIRALCSSFVYDRPRPAVCCRLGKIFTQQSKWEQAVFWYHTALDTPRQEESGAFISEDDTGYLPCIQLAFCYGKLKQPEKGRYYNDLAGGFKPQDPHYLHNKTYYEGILGS